MLKRSFCTKCILKSESLAMSKEKKNWFPFDNSCWKIPQGENFQQKKNSNRNVYEGFVKTLYFDLWKAKDLKKCVQIKCSLRLII